MKEIKTKPTTEETKAAINLQAPHTVQGEDKPIQRTNTFAQLARVSRDAHITFGGRAQWIQPINLFNDKYREGFESVPFYITKAWQFTSKHGYGERLGLEIVLSDSRMYYVALGLTEGDLKRNDILDMFAERNASPLGPLCMRLLPLDKGNDYYDVVPYENVVGTTEGVDIPFVEINDKDIPF